MSEISDLSIGGELKPCAFCGAEPSAFLDANHSTAFEIGCYNESCDLMPNVWAISEAKAVEQWNTRAPDPALAAKDALIDRLKLEAQIHSMEARGANATIGEIYQAVTGKTGEPGNWNGAQPVIEALAAKDAEIKRLRESLEFISYMHDGNPPLVLADIPEIDYARRTISSMRSEARKALRGEE